MKLLIASDLHGSSYFVEKLIQRIDAEQPDKILLLGDLLYHGPRNALPELYDTSAVAKFLNDRKNMLLCVRGNCDASIDQMLLPFPMMADYLLLDLGKTRLRVSGERLWCTSFISGALGVGGHIRAVSFEGEERA